MVIFAARQNLANLNEVNMNLIFKFANLAGKSYSKDDYCNHDYGKNEKMNSEWKTRNDDNHQRFRLEEDGQAVQAVLEHILVSCYIVFS